MCVCMGSYILATCKVRSGVGTWWVENMQTINNGFSTRTVIKAYFKSIRAFALHAENNTGLEAKGIQAASRMSAGFNLYYIRATH